MEDTITLTALLAAVFRGWKKVIATALMVAVALGGFQTAKQIEASNAPENTPEQIEQRYAEALATYEAEKGRLEFVLEKAERAYASKQEYMEESFIPALDPYNEYVTYITVSITGINEGAMTQVTPYEGIVAEYMVNTVRAQYLALWMCADIVQILDDPRYADIKEKYLRELIYVEEKEGGLFEIQVFANSSAETERIANSIYNYFNTQQEKISESSYDHKLLVVNRATKCIINEGLINAQQVAIDAVKAAEEAVNEAQAELNALQAPQKEVGYGTAVIAKAVSKFALVGFVIGAVLTCFGICCSSLFSNKVNSTYQLERITALRFLGTPKAQRNIFDWIANRLAEERTWSNKEQARSYLVEQVKVLCGADKQLLVLSTLSAKKVETATNELAEVLKVNGYSVKLILDAAHNPETIRMMRENNHVLLAESVGISQMSVVLDVIAQAKASEKQILGFAMI